MALLEINNLGISFGGLRAVDAFNLKIEKGQLYGLIGPNGAGKTTAFNLLTGVYKPSQGRVLLDGEDITGKSVIEINRTGVARTFQNIRLFANMTVLDNVKIGLTNSMKTGLLACATHFFGYSKEEKKANDRAMELLDFFGMRDKAQNLAGSLPYGDQRRLEIIRALATNPSILLLDEPAAGMNPSETADLMNTIRKIRDEFQIAIMLIEHDMNLVMGVCEGICVLNFGKIIAKGTPEEIQSNPAVIEAYLGTKKEEDE